MSDNFEWLNYQDFIKNSAWWNIYENSFPPSERDSKEQLSEALKKGIAKIGYYRQEENIVAIAVIYHIKPPQFIFLHYFAVSKTCRNCGLGSKLFQALINFSDHALTHYESKRVGLVWEVEDPDESIDEVDKGLRQRRIEFYLRQGAKLLNGKFIQPPIDGKNTVSMRLMHYPLEDKSNSTLPEREISRAIYFGKYQVVNEFKTDFLLNLLN